MKIYGRFQQVAALVAAGKVRSVRLLLFGPSGVGKSSLSEAWRTQIPSPEVVLFYKFQGKVFGIDDFTSSIMKQILEKSDLPSFNFKDFRAALNESSSSKVGALLSAGVLDIVEGLSPILKHTSEVLTRTLKESYTDSQIHAQVQSIAARPAELARGLVNILNALSKFGVSASIFLDSIENAPEAVVAVIVALTTTMPRNWNLAITVDDEVDEGNEILKGQFRSAIRKKELNLDGVPGINVPDIEEWCRDHRKAAPPDQEVLHKVHERSQGRPLFIEPWIKSGDQMMSDKVLAPNDSYSARLNALGDGLAVRLVNLLSLFPRNSTFTFDTMHRLVESVSIDDTHRAIRLLDQNLFLQRLGEDNYTFLHDLIPQTIAAQLPRPLRQQCALRTLAFLNGEPQLLSLDAYKYTRAVLADYAGEYSSITDEELGLGDRLTRRGAFSEAFSCYRSVISAGRKSNNSSLYCRATLQLAKACFESGTYTKGLRELAEIDRCELQNNQAADLQFLKGSLFLRLNQYGDAKAHLAEAEAIYTQANNADGTIRCKKQLNVILRDLESYDEAQAQADQLLVQIAEIKKDHHVSEETEAACYRAAARSYAFSAENQGRALQAATRALEIAERIVSTSAMASAHLAAGESYRHAGMQSEAIAEYLKARELSLSVGDRDCYLWATICASDSYLLNLDIERAEELLADAGDIVQYSPEAHPLEHAHWKLSDNVIKFKRQQISADEVKGLPELYDKLKLQWPGQYIQEVISRADYPTTPKNF